MATNEESQVRFDDSLVPVTTETEVNRDGYDVERQFYSEASVPPAHARPLNLDPRVNGPFLDEVHEVELHNAREAKWQSEERKKAAEESKAHTRDAAYIEAEDEEAKAAADSDKEKKEQNVPTQKTASSQNK